MENNMLSELIGEIDEMLAPDICDSIVDIYEENEKLATSVKALSKKVNKLNEDKSNLLEAVDYLEDSRGKPFKSSEKAVIITEDVDKREANKPDAQAFNDLLTPEVMKFMPQSDLK